MIAIVDPKKAKQYEMNISTGAAGQPVENGL